MTDDELAAELRRLGRVAVNVFRRRAQRRASVLQLNPNAEAAVQRQMKAQDQPWWVTSRSP